MTRLDPKVRYPRARKVTLFEFITYLEAALHDTGDHRTCVPWQCPEAHEVST